MLCILPEIHVKAFRVFYGKSWMSGSLPSVTVAF